MARVLMAWEIGQNFGHVMPLLSIAKALRARGHDVSFAVKDLRQVSAIVRAEGFLICQAPAHPGMPVLPGGLQPETMADILKLHGYQDTGTLHAYLLAWRELLGRTASELLVASYAPTALLAARTLGLRTAVAGTAFELPPPVSPLPSFRPWLKTPEAALRDSDAKVAEVVNAVVGRYGRHISAAWEVFAAQRQVLWTFPELDPFATQRKVGAATITYSGGLFPSHLGELIVWPKVDGPRVLAYFRYPTKTLEPIVERLANMPAAFSVVAPDLDAFAINKLTRANVSFTSRAIQLAPALSACQALVGYASHGTACAALLQGKPMVLVPEHMEGVMLTNQIVRLGAAAHVRRPDPERLTSALAEVLADSRFGTAAGRFMHKYRGYDPELQAMRISELFGMRLANSP